MKLFHQAIIGLGLFTLLNGLPRTVYAQQPPDTTTQMTAQDIYNQGRTKARQGLDAESIADYTEAIKLKPDFAEAYLYRGYAQVGIGEDVAGLSDLRMAAKLYRERGDTKIADILMQDVQRFETEIREEQQSK
jgi:tetratricopeptide (TPR) repeat protein